MLSPGPHGYLTAGSQCAIFFCNEIRQVSSVALISIYSNLMVFFPELFCVRSLCYQEVDLFFLNKLSFSFMGTEIESPLFLLEFLPQLVFLFCICSTVHSFCINLRFFLAESRSEFHHGFLDDL